MNAPDMNKPHPVQRHGAETLMAACLGVMACSVFLNVVLRYGFGSGVAASEELSRLLFVWMVFIGAARGLSGRRAHGLHQPGGPAAQTPARCSGWPRC